MIRRCEEKDVQSVYELICILEETAFDETEFNRIYMMHLQDHNHVCFVYEEEGSILALLHMRMEYQLHHCARIAEITELCVRPEARNQKIGSRLFNYACEYARNNRCVRIELVTNQRRKDAHRFYEREGMHQSHYGYTLDL